MEKQTETKTETETATVSNTDADTQTRTPINTCAYTVLGVDTSSSSQNIQRFYRISPSCSVLVKLTQPLTLTIGQFITTERPTFDHTVGYPSDAPWAPYGAQSRLPTGPARRNINT